MIRLMTLDDLGFADSLRAITGWNQTLADWRRFLACEPNGCFVAESEGARVGTATTIRYENKIAWIGMVLVHPDHRRKGIGHALLNRCIDYLREQNVQTIKLDATPLGQKLYETLGFEEESTLRRWRGFVSESNQRTHAPPNLAKVFALDANSFGALRIDLLLKLNAQSETAFIDDEGFGMIRPGSQAHYLGPVIATNHIAARKILNSLLKPGKTIIYIPDTNTTAAAWAQSQGFVPERPLIRMRLGPEIIPTAPQTLYAIAAPEVG